jgi:D-alanyl-D-alanine carboxypeptidase (penicillin-binding protein 5/6)
MSGFVSPVRAKFLFFAAMTVLSRRFVALVCCAALLPLAAFAAKARPTRPAAETGGSYKGAIAINAATGDVLIQENAEIVTPPASMTKLMTFAVLSDKLASGAIALSTPVQIDASDAKIGGTQVYLDPRETFSVEELIYAMMIQSANDAAHALARTAGGSVPAFVQLMNAKAHELGMTHTTFRSPHGLPPSSRRIDEGDLTTPHDFALLCRYLVQKTDVLKYTSVRNRDFGAGRAKGPQHMRNHNNLLGKIAGVDGLKTGYTAGAGYCLSATAQRNGQRVIVVIMGALGPGGQRDLGHSRDLKTVELIERAFAAIPATAPRFTSAVPAPEVSPVSSVPLTADEKKAAEAEQAEDEGPAVKFTMPEPQKPRKP